MPLDKYRDKRDFQKTPEPPGGETSQRDQLHFVVHKHHATRLHWDLRLELDGVLKSWAVPKGPTLDPGEKRLAVMVEDHPIDYQTFEGVIPDGNYGAGPVMIWDRGTYTSRESADTDTSVKVLRKGLEEGHITFVLHGERLRGEFALVKLKKGEQNGWLLIKKNDDNAQVGDMSRFGTSVASRRTMEEIEQAPGTNRIDLSGAPESRLPDMVKPMLATLISEPFDRAGWIFEIKWDGYRCLARVRSGQAVIYSRNGKVLNDRFPLIAQALTNLPFDAYFDGEVVALDDSGRADFKFLQDFGATGKGELVYYIFDIPYYDGHDLRGFPLSRRKGILRQLLSSSPPRLKYSDHVDGEGIGLFQAARENSVEGIVAKNGESPYRPGTRSLDWLKIKATLSQETVISGFTQGRAGRKGFGSLVLGVYDGRNDLVYVGHAGSGLTDTQLSSLRTRLQELAAAGSPFARPPRITEPVTWVRPELVCEVRFSEWTTDGLMRHPVFLGLREDMDPIDVRREAPQSTPEPVHTDLSVSEIQPSRTRRLSAINDHKVDLTNLDKVYWPEEGYTKRDVIEYYRAVSPYILPYIKGKPESLHRHPNGIHGEAFYQKNVENLVPGWIRTVKVRSESESKEVTYLVCDDEASLLFMANLGCIEINPWHSRVGNLENPDYMILDLDPLDVPFREVIRAAQATHDVLDEIQVPSFCKTSGATGLHVYLPLGGKYSYDQSAQFAHLVNTLVQSRLPLTTSLVRSPAKRQRRVYLDYLQNRKGQTVAAPYSIRPLPGAPVSTPLLWREVIESLDPSEFTMINTMSRLKQRGDVWKDVIGPGIEMELCLEGLTKLIDRR